LQYVCATIAVQIRQKQTCHFTVHRISLVQLLEPDCVRAASKKDRYVVTVAIHHGNVRAAVPVEICERQLPRTSAYGHFGRENQFPLDITVCLDLICIADRDDNVIPAVPVKVREFGIPWLSIHVEALDQIHVERRISGETSPRFE